jgi:hypothetical protein
MLSLEYYRDVTWAGGSMRTAHLLAKQVCLGEKLCLAFLNAGLSHPLLDMTSLLELLPDYHAALDSRLQRCSSLRVERMGKFSTELAQGHHLAVAHGPVLEQGDG